MALITTAEARRYLPHNTGSTDDTLIDALVTAAEHLLAAYCGFPPASETVGPTLEQATYTFYLDGPDPSDDQLLVLPVRPVVSITSVHADPDLGYGSTYEISSGNYRLDNVRGHLRLLPTSTEAWAKAPEANRVIMVGGLTTGSVPEYVKIAMGMQVKALWDLRHTGGVQSATVEGKTATRRPETIPHVVKQMLAPLVMWERRLSGGSVVGIG